MFYSLQPLRCFFLTNKNRALMKTAAQASLYAHATWRVQCCLLLMIFSVHTLWESSRQSGKLSQRANPRHPVSHACSISALFHSKCQSSATSSSWQLNAGSSVANCAKREISNPVTCGKRPRVWISSVCSVWCGFIKSRTGFVNQLLALS